MLPNVQRTDAADHVPVLAEEVRELLDVQPGETVVDATFGAGGHSRLLAEDLVQRQPSTLADHPRVEGVDAPVGDGVARRPAAAEDGWNVVECLFLPDRHVGDDVLDRPVFDDAGHRHLAG